ncbi:LysR family transcriptional regulator (plasmid) [Rhodococcus globerulus]|uniref:LysR family transcriptional regulator n=1 Tax=Rhodococcus globerulus TaxID=33008 RepID=UPI0039E95C64
MSSSIDDLTFFGVVAESETLTAAARQLGCSLPVVSRRLTALERRLGARLVHRGTRRLTLTSEGQTYASRLESILDQVRALEDEVADGDAGLSGSIVVQATLGLGRVHIAPLVGEFAASHPRVHLQLVTSALPLRPHRNAFDVAVHVGTPPDSSMRIRRLSENRRVPCASPSYLEERGIPRVLGDLADHSCIVLHENEGDFDLWRFGDAVHPQYIRVGGALSGTDGEVVTNWALEGRGIIMRSEWQVRPYLRRGELVRVLPDMPTPPADIYALTNSTVHVPRRFVALIDHLVTRLPARLAEQ